MQKEKRHISFPQANSPENNSKTQKDPEALLLSRAPESAIDLQGMASRRTAMGGALGMGLLSSNIDQLLTILSMNDLPTGEYVKVGLIGFSLVLQVSFCFF